MNFRYDPTEEKLNISSGTRIEYEQLRIWLTRKVKGYRYMPAFKLGVWSGDQTYFENGEINLGLWKECYKACKEIGVTFNIENRDEFPLNREITLEKVQEFCNNFFKDHKVKNKEGNWVPFMPYDYQIESAYKILKNKYVLSQLATSAGKSLVISIVYFYILTKMDSTAKSLIIVPSISLVTQFYDNIIEYNYGSNFIEEFKEKIDFRNPTDINIIKEKYPDYNPCMIKMEEIMSDTPRKFIGPTQPNIYIGTFQSLDKYPKNFFHQFYSIAVDESHQAKAATLKSILSKTFKYASYRFGVSGTFPPEDSLEILAIQSVLGPIITDISADQLIKKGTITPLIIKAVILNHNEKDLAEKISYLRKKGAGKDVFQFEKEFVQQSEKRLDFIKKIVNKCEKNTLLLFHTIEYGQKIFNKLKSEIMDKDFHYIDGEISGKKREEIKKEMEKIDGKPKILVASFGTMSLGVSLRNLHYLIMADSFKSEQIVIQAIGRLLRLFDGKEKAVIFDLVDIFDDKMKNILYSHFLEREKMYKKRKYPFEIKKILL